MLDNWAVKWGIPQAAIIDLKQMFGTDSAAPGLKTQQKRPEAQAQRIVRLKAAKKGVPLWRNNKGAAYCHPHGFMRFGLVNETAEQGKNIKSSDLVGIRPVEVYPGRVIGQFVAREIKPGGWKYTGTEHERAQLRFLEIVAAHGGDAAFTTGDF